MSDSEIVGVVAGMDIGKGSPSRVLEVRGVTPGKFVDNH